jgi:hypothetical protein
MDNPKDSDVLGELGEAGRLKNVTFAGMLRWRAGRSRRVSSTCTPG